MEHDATTQDEILLSVVVPVFNLEGSIVDNVGVIDERVRAGLDGAIEVIVVSDGSIDGTEERLLESGLGNVRVLHYDRNLGKGYAIKVGALESRGRWIGYVDADLDLDPADLADFVVTAERERLDFAIGSKRHPESIVTYPSSRRVVSWLFQQLVRVLFGLEVRDTQVGLKVFRREVAEQVLPLLLVKRFAFDIELLAVSRAFGFVRVKELPVVLDYKFTGSGVRSSAALYALVDTFAVFYRLRILAYYQRRRAFGGADAWARPHGARPEVTLVSSEPDDLKRLDYEHVQHVVLAEDDIAGRRQAAEQAHGEIVAFVEAGARPSGNWVSAGVPFFSRAELDAVVTPRLAPSGGSVRRRAAAAIAESRVGGGSLYFRSTPGNIRFVSDFPAKSFLVRRDRFLALPASTPPEEVVHELAARGGRVVYLPEASVTAPPPPLFAPHLARIASYGRGRGSLVRRHGRSAVRLSTIGALALLFYALVGWALAFAGPTALDVWLACWTAYAVLIVAAGALGGLRFRSLPVFALTVVGLLLTHAVYIAAFASGFAGAGSEPGGPGEAAAPGARVAA